VVDQVVQQRRIDDRLDIKLLPGDGGANNGEDAGADDRANPQRRKSNRAQRLLQPRLRTLRIRDQLVDRLLGKELILSG
jgi:hypothetical protein